jgi:predicted deacetylase
MTVHVECIYLDSAWEKIKEQCLQGKILKWYVMTPANYELFRSNFFERRSKKELSKIMAERYKWMLDNGQELQLHAHLSIPLNMNYKEQESLIKESFEWFETNLGYKPTEFVAGWWMHDENTLKVLGKYDMKLITQKDYMAMHDYNWIIKKIIG